VFAKRRKKFSKPFVNEQDDNNRGGGRQKPWNPLSKIISFKNPLQKYYSRLLLAFAEQSRRFEARNQRTIFSSNIRTKWMQFFLISSTQCSALAARG
jgi:hypothetical protein